MVIFYKKWKKYNEIQLTKSKMDLNIRKMTNHPPSPEETVDPIHWSHPPTSWKVPPEHLVYSINLCSLSRESTLQPSA